jgi:hypothetical protein
MIENLNDYLTGIAIGIRFRPNFSIEDQFGKIIDTILYSKDTFFDPDVFPEVQSNLAAKILINPKTDDKLHFDSSNIILEINFDAASVFDKDDTVNILNAFKKQILESVFRVYRIQDIVRIGYIRRYLFTMEELANSFIRKTIGQTLEGINDISLRFSKKIPLSMSLAKEDVNDYDNSIFTVIKKADKKEIFMAVDYQSFFDPFLQHSEMIKFDEFIEKADNFNANTYRTWLNSNYAEVLNEQAI